MACSLSIGQPVTWRGEEYLVQACMRLTGPDFAWILCDLHPALAGGEGCRVALSDGDVHEVSHGGDWEGMCEPGREDCDADFLGAEPPAEHHGGELLRLEEATYEANYEGETLAFDRGRLLEYEAADGGRVVVFVSQRRWVEFEARAVGPGELVVPESVPGA
jgi:hypothetical protein